MERPDRSMRGDRRVSTNCAGEPLPDADYHPLMAAMKPTRAATPLAGAREEHTDGPAGPLAVGAKDHLRGCERIPENAPEQADLVGELGCSACDTWDERYPGFNPRGKEPFIEKSQIVI